MKKQISPKNQESRKEKIIQHALKTSGFLFPTTINEVENYELTYGSTDIILPEELQEPDFLFNEQERRLINNESLETIAMAARDGIDAIPDHIKKRMKQEREIARRNKKTNG
jgi:ubiquinone biosynthesis protein COQ9